LYMGANKKGLT